MRKPNRREFLALGGAAVFAARGKANPLGLPIGIQPYTVRQEMQKDLAGTLKQLAAMGYGAVEVGDPFYGARPSDLRDLLKSLGLSSPSGFYPSPKTKDDWARSIERAKALEVTYLITDGWGKTLDALKQRADQFNELGAVCKKAGTVVAYHNHNFEYKTVDGVVTYEAVLSVDNSQLLLRPGMTATADITVRKLDDALLVPNAALRFAPPALAEAQPASDRRGFLSRLVPHPPSPPARPTETAGARQQQQKVWTLRDQQLVAIPITVGATDGRMTEVVAGEIQPGLQVVTDTVEVHG